MKKLLLSLTILFCALFSNGQYRYGIVPEGGGYYQVPNKEQRTVAYTSTIALSTTHEETFVKVGTLTGALTMTISVTDPVTTLDRLSIVFLADGTDRVVTFSTGFSANGALTVTASTYKTVAFIFDGVNWVEQTRGTGSTTTGLFGAGSAAAPSISFTGQTDLGLYKVSSTELGFTAGGVKSAGLSTTGLTVAGTTTSTGNFTVGANKLTVTATTGATGIAGLLSPAAAINNSAGTVGAPAYSYTGQTDMGRYKISSTQEGQAISGALVGGWGATGLFTNYITEQTSGQGITFSKATIHQYSNTAYTTNSTISAAELAKGLITVTSGTLTLTLPTATDLGTQLGGVAGTVFDFVVLNAAAGGTVTIAVGSGITASTFPGTNTLTLANSATVGVATFRITFISATVATLARIS